MLSFGWRVGEALPDANRKFYSSALSTGSQQPSLSPSPPAGGRSTHRQGTIPMNKLLAILIASAFAATTAVAADAPKKDAKKAADKPAASASAASAAAKKDEK